MTLLVAVVARLGGSGSSLGGGAVSGKVTDLDTTKRNVNSLYPDKVKVGEGTNLSTSVAGSSTGTGTTSESTTGGRRSAHGGDVALATTVVAGLGGVSSSETSLLSSLSVTVRGLLLRAGSGDVSGLTAL